MPPAAAAADECGGGGSASPKIGRSATAATAVFELSAGPPGSTLGGESVVGFPSLPGVPRGARVASDGAFELFRASHALQCAAVVELLLSLLSAFALWGSWWSVAFLCCGPFAIVGRVAAANYSRVWSQLYAAYLFCAMMAHLLLAVLLFTAGYLLSGFVEAFKAVAYFWFLTLSLRFRAALARVQGEEKARLRSGNFTVARFEYLVFI